MKSVTGIANLGNTCYMNAALQCGVIACEPLAKYFLAEEYLEDLSGISSSDSLAKAVAWLLDEVRNPELRNAVYPNLVKNRVDVKMAKFKGTEQNDCSEFLLEFLDILHSELSIGADKRALDKRSGSSSMSMLTRSASLIAAMNGSISGRSRSSINWHSRGDQWWSAHRKREDSIIKRLYEGAIRSVMTCARCGGVSARFEAFTSLILPIPSYPSSEHRLSDLIDQLFQEEQIDGIDCDFCKRKQTFNRTIDLWKVPPFLILTLSRFSFTSKSAKKLTNFVTYPVDLPLSLENLLAQEAPLQEFLEYELYAVVEHEGTVNRGHYTALVKSNDGQWAIANDSKVLLGVDLSRISSNNAYMLFYRWKILGEHHESDEYKFFDLEDYLAT